jgi:serine/threonine-protein kinase
MAPELIEGQALADEACDVFSLGVVLFEAVTRKLPWEGDTDVAIAIERLQRPPADPRDHREGLPHAFAEIILRCLARDRSQRFATAQAVGRALSSVVLPSGSLAPTRMPPRSPLDTLPAWSLSSAPSALGRSTSGSTKAVAVLPFRKTSAEVETYLVDGLTEAVIDGLSTDPALRVRPRGMVMALARPSGAKETEAKKGGAALELGERLGVQVVVEGTVDRRADTLSVVVRVTSLPTGFRVWAGSFERDASLVLELGDEVAAAVAHSLSTSHRPARKPRPRDPKVADLYLRARHAYHGILHDGAMHAVDLFLQALALAPDDAAIQAGYALACVRESAFTGVGFDRAAEAAERAQALDPHEPEARVALAAVKLQRGEPVRAVEHLRAALGVDPSLGEAHALLGRILLEADVLDVAKKRLEWAIAMEPEQNVARRDLARVHALSGRYQEVERLAAQEPPENDVGAWLDRARFGLWRKNGDAAALYLEALRTRNRDTFETLRGPLGLARALLRCVAEGATPFEDDAFIDFVGRGRGTPRRSAFVSQIEAEVAAVLGKPDEALAAIVRAADAGLADLAWLDRCPLFADLKGAEEFERARARVGAVAAEVREAVFDG